TRGEGGSHSSGAPSRASRARSFLSRRAQLNAVFGGRGSARMKVGLNLVLLLSSLFLVGCDACGSEDDVRVSSPDRKHVAHSYLQNCGATTDYVTMVDLEAPGSSHGVAAYSAEGAYSLTLRWASTKELHIECRGCPPRYPGAPQIDGISVTVISARRGSSLTPHL